MQGYALVNAIVRGGITTLPLVLGVAWLTSAWWLLVLPAVWWLALLFLLLKGQGR